MPYIQNADLNNYYELAGIAFMGKGAVIWVSQALYDNSTVIAAALVAGEIIDYTGVGTPQPDAIPHQFETEFQMSIRSGATATSLQLQFLESLGGFEDSDGNLYTAGDTFITFRVELVDNNGNYLLWEGLQGADPGDGSIALTLTNDSYFKSGQSYPDTLGAGVGEYDLTDAVVDNFIVTAEVNGGRAIYMTWWGTNQAALTSAIASLDSNGGTIVIPPAIGWDITIPEITNTNIRIEDQRINKMWVITNERSNLQAYLKQIAGGFTHPLTLIKRAAGGGQPYEFDIFMPCNRHGSKFIGMRMSSYNTKDPSESNYGVLRMGQGNIAITERPITRIEEDTTWATLIKTGTWNAWLQLAGTDEWYTFSTDYTTPATITATVKGSNIWMAAPCATNGGRCYVTVDSVAANANKLPQTGGNAYIDFDVVGDTIHKHIQIAEGLADINHTVVFTHVNNGTPTARTYFSSVWGTDAKDSSGILDEVMAWGADFRAWDSLGNRCDDTVMSPTASAFEYGFWNREPGVGSYGWSGTIHGWEDYEYIKIYADGELVNDYYASLATNDCIWCKEIVIVQQSKLLTPGNAARVWGRMQMVHKFTSDGINVKTHLVYLLAQQLGDSYRAMLPTMDIYSSSISRIFGTGKGRIETTGIANTINGNPGVITDYDTGTHTTCGVLWSAESDLVYVMKIANQGMVGDFANSERDFFLQDRTDDNNKLYCQMYNTAAPTTVPAGTVEDTDLTYQFLEISDADRLLTNYVERL